MADDDITVSRAVLRAELAEMKLDLVQRLATKEEMRAISDSVANTAARVSVLEVNQISPETQIAYEKRLASQEAWRTRLAGGLVALLALVPFVNWYFGS